jgi:DNA-binding response OmpR family regulator
MVGKLLLVDDEEMMVKYLLRRLEIRGFEVTTAFSGKVAIAAVQKNDFDVVLLDLLMPEMDGIETLKQIKKLSPSTEVIMLTAYSSRKIDEESKFLGAFDLVLKPFDLEDFIKRIELAMSHRLRCEPSVGFKR